MLEQGHGIKEDAMSYQDTYLAEKLLEYHREHLEKSLELARVLREGSADRPGPARRLLSGAGEALIFLGQRLKEQATPSGDFASECG